MAIEGPTLIFVEVKYRAPSKFGPSAFAVTARQQKRIAQTAALFRSQRSEYCHLHCRFDIIGFDQLGGHVQMTWLKAAFSAIE